MVKGSVFSCDLVANAKLHMLFLKQCHIWMTSFNHDESSFLIESLRRYQKLWLPLVASEQTATQRLVPPPDIAWLWHCHRLAPKEYCNYCLRELGFIVEANPPFAVALLEGSANGSLSIAPTQSLWKERYPNEPFFLPEKYCVSNSAKLVDTLPKIGDFDLLGSTKRQATFLWQVSGERFSDDDFLTEGVENYAKFLLLKQKATQQHVTLVPTYQIDLMWHTHMLTSMQQYHADCLRIMNSKLHHDDSLTDRSDGGLLDVSYRATKELWRNEYGTEYVVWGGMYRGEPPKEYYGPHTNGCTFTGESSVCSIPQTNQHLIGKVGATSTSPRPTQWASVKDLTSYGRPAFILTDEQTRDDVKNLKYMEDYVLGRIQGRTGYYHIETKEAHYILLHRVQARVRTAQCDSACRWCALRKIDAQFEKEFAALLDTEAELKERLRAPTPGGSQRQADDRTYAGNDGYWRYLPIYTNAGGACGGAVASGRFEAFVVFLLACGQDSPSFLPVSGPGGGGCGGGCGGGGCGGGGCGEGGCGG
jgi:hypothetical protein